MAYMKTVMMDVEEAVESEIIQGFDSRDEYNEVMRDIAREYNVSLVEVIKIANRMCITH